MVALLAVALQGFGVTSTHQKDPVQWDRLELLVVDQPANVGASHSGDFRGGSDSNVVGGVDFHR
jgi:hypothetical protein